MMKMMKENNTVVLVVVRQGTSTVRRELHRTAIHKDLHSKLECTFAFGPTDLGCDRHSSDLQLVVRPSVETSAHSLLPL